MQMWFLFMMTLKVMTCCWVIPGSLITSHTGAESMMGETLVLYCSVQQSVSGLLLLQINLEVSGAPCCSISACCLERREGRVTWELPLSSFILCKLALHSQDIEDYCDSAVEDRVRWHDKFDRMVICDRFPVTPHWTTTQCWSLLWYIS